jgi:hypothetical protein
VLIVLNEHVDVESDGFFVPQQDTTLLANMVRLVEPELVLQLLSKSGLDLLNKRDRLARFDDWVAFYFQLDTNDLVLVLATDSDLLEHRVDLLNVDVVVLQGVAVLRNVLAVLQAQDAQVLYWYNAHLGLVNLSALVIACLFF